MRSLGVYEYHGDGLVIKLGPPPAAPPAKDEEGKPAKNPQPSHMEMLSRSSSIKLWDK